MSLNIYFVALRIVALIELCLVFPIEDYVTNLWNIS